MSKNIAISVQNLTKTYLLYNSNLERVKEALHPLRRKYHHEFNALHDISFEIKKGETVGIIGKNGSGKSTLLKIITGVLTPTCGNVTVNGRVSALLELGSGFNPELTGIENVYFNGTLMGYSREEMNDKLDDILAFADIGEFVYQPVKSYSSGMFVRLAFAVATIIDTDILIVDEALSVGDIFFQQKCYARLKELKERGVTILFVTHSMGDVIQYCKTSLLLNNNKLEYMGLSGETVKRYLLLQQQQRLASYVSNISHNDSEIISQLRDESIDVWPEMSQFEDLSTVDVVSSGIANCSGVALCNVKGVSSKLFASGDSATIFCEFEISSPIEVPIGGFIIKNEQNILVHGKNSLHYDDLLLPTYVNNNHKIRFRFDLRLDIAPGDYTIDVGLATMHKKDYAERSITSPAQFQAKTLRLCNLSGAISFTVIHRPIMDNCYGSLHAGMCNLKGSSRVSILSPAKEFSNERTEHMTIFHVTHWKAGSQWIKKILKEAVPELYVESKIGVAHFLKDTVKAGMVYPTVYVTKEQFDSVPIPTPWRRFVIIRDLRDTLVSGYFSLKISHSIISSGISSYRDKLVSLNLDDGLIYLMDEWLYLSADIQKSWLYANESFVKYEAILNDDVEVLTNVLIDKCQLPVTKDRLRDVIINNRFEKVTGGRKSGTADISAHERKGVAGDWRNYFTPEVKKYFKARYGELLIATGYEDGNDW